MTDHPSQRLLNRTDDGSGREKEGEEEAARDPTPRLPVVAELQRNPEVVLTQRVNRLLQLVL